MGPCLETGTVEEVEMKSLERRRETSVGEFWAGSRCSGF